MTEDVFRLHAQELRMVSRSRAIIDGDLAAGFREIASAAARGLCAERATIWIYTPDFSELHSVAELKGEVVETSEKVLDRERFKSYFDALDQERVCVVPD